MRRLLIPFAVIAAVALVGGAAYLGLQSGQAQNRPAEPPPATVAVTRGDVEQSVAAPGQMECTQQVQLAMATSGQLARIVVRPGDSVHAGDVLAQLDQAPLRKALDDARAALERAEPEDARQLAAAQLDLTVAQANLAKPQAAGPDGGTAEAVTIAQHRLEQAKNTLWGAQAQRDSTCGRAHDAACDGAQASVQANEEAVRIEGAPGQAGVVSVLPAVDTFHGFGFDAQAEADGRRSDHRVEVAVHNKGGELLGYVRLSEGPAYGLEIVDSVARGWVVASAVAVGLAALAGWLVSRSVSQPVLALSAVTARMADGDLSARADTGRQDEFGQLAGSFNQMAGRVEEMITALRRFVADAAHELHTPLTALRTNLELAAGNRPRRRRRLPGARPGPGGPPRGPDLEPAGPLALRGGGGASPALATRPLRAGTGGERAVCLARRAGGPDLQPGDAHRAGHRAGEPGAVGACPGQPAGQRLQVHARRR